MKQVVLHLATVTIISFFTSTAIAKSEANSFTYVLSDSAVPSIHFGEQNFFLHSGSEGAAFFVNDFYAEEKYISELATIEAEYSKSGNNKKTLLRLLRTLRAKRILHSKKVSTRFFTDLAKISARLKLYSLAMQSYYDATAADEKSLNVLNTDSVFFAGNYNFKEDNIRTKFAIDTLTINEGTKEIESPPMSITDVFDSFDDHKPAENYALIIEVKQPVPGKRKPFKGIGNVGHMFITLIKYNLDSTVVSRSFGFYPDKHASFVATPIHPGAPSVFKDDALHDWDELAGKFISRKRFEKILRLLDVYEKKSYNLNHNNCTDFGLFVAAIGGIDIDQASSKWPLGKGNNPANAGQSILEKKIKNSDTGNMDGLFICSSKKLEN